MGTGICLVIERDPITLAKEVASLDVLSRGRFLFGIGGGWNLEEMTNHGTDPTRRWRLLRERVLAMKAIWTRDEAEFHGELVNFDPIWSYPKPVCKPHPPILLGGEGRFTLRRVVRFCDGWFPRGRGDPDISGGVAELRALAEMAGRDPRTISVSVFGAKPEESTLRSYENTGVDRAVLPLPSATRDTVLPLLDRYAELARAFA